MKGYVYTREGHRGAVVVVVLAVVLSTTSASAVEAHESDGPLISTDPAVVCAPLDLERDVTLFAGDMAVGRCTWGKTKVQLGGEGERTAVPVPFGGTEMFDQDGTVTVQLHNGEGACWTSEFTAAGTTSNDAGRLRARTP